MNLPMVIPAHGVGSRQDLPLPFEALLIGAALALVISFIALRLLWKKPRLDPAGGWALPGPIGKVLGAASTRRTIATIALLVTGWMALALFAGKDDANNPAIYAIYVWLWVGVAFLSILIGPIWAWANPIRALHRLILLTARVEPDFKLLPYRLGYWPAATGLFAFTWLELIAPDRATAPVLRIAVLAFVLVSVLMALVFGRGYFNQGDPFEAYSRLYGSLGTLGRRPDQQWVLRPLLHGTNQIPNQTGLLAVTSVMLGGTAYDSFSGETAWYTLVQSSGTPPLLLETLGLLTACLLISGSLGLAAAISARLAHTPVRGLPTAFAPSLIPIAAGYVIAHYWSLLMYEGVHGLQHATDPLGNGANWLGTAGLEPTYALIAPGLVAAIQVIAIITGHLFGVALAHERALTHFDRRTAVAGQIPLLILMVGYTVGGLSLLFTA